MGNAGQRRALCSLATSGVLKQPAAGKQQTQFAINTQLGAAPGTGEVSDGCEGTEIGTGQSWGAPSHRQAAGLGAPTSEMGNPS